MHRAARAHPEKLATICGDRRNSYATLQDRVSRLAVYWAGGVVNAANTRWSAAEIAYSFADCDTRILFIDDQFLPMLAAIRQQAPCVSTVIHSGTGKILKNKLREKHWSAHNRQMG